MHAASTCADLVWFSVHDAIRSCARSFVTVSDETARRPRFRVRSCAFVHCSNRSSSFELAAAADPEELAAFAISGFRGDAAADEDDAPFDGDGDGSIVATTSDGFATSCAVKSAARRASSSFRSCTAVASFEPPHPMT